MRENKAGGGPSPESAPSKHVLQGKEGIVEWETYGTQDDLDAIFSNICIYF